MNALADLEQQCPYKSVDISFSRDSPHIRNGVIAFELEPFTETLFIYEYDPRPLQKHL